MHIYALTFQQYILCPVATVMKLNENVSRSWCSSRGHLSCFMLASGRLPPGAVLASSAWGLLSQAYGAVPTLAQVSTMMPGRSLASHPGPLVWRSTTSFFLTALTVIWLHNWPFFLSPTVYCWLDKARILPWTLQNTPHLGQCFEHSCSQDNFWVSGNS